MNIDSYHVTCSYSFPDIDRCSKYQRNELMNLSIPHGQSSLYLLEKSANMSENFHFSVSYGNTGYIVTQINGVESTDNCKWVFYISSDIFPLFKPIVSVDQYILSSNDHVEFQYRHNINQSNIVNSKKYSKV